MSIKRCVQIALLLMVVTSGILLGISQRNLELTLIGVVGGICGFVCADLMQWFRLRGVLANAASIIVLIFAMRDFIGGDGATKLIAVSQLLVYLQTVLMFQDKTPRLNWQLLVLSLLQIVVAGIFNLDFEGGLLFVAYFAIAGVTLILQSIYTGNFKIQGQNQRSSESFQATFKTQTALVPVGAGAGGAAAGFNRPFAVHDSVSSNLTGYGRVFQHLSLWLLASLIFAAALFCIIPRGEQAWFGPSYFNTSATGATKKVDLNEQGLIEPSSNLVMRVWFEKVTGPDTRAPHKPPGTVYMRGMALSNLEIVEGRTSWEAPQDRVYPTHIYKNVGKAEPTQKSVIQRVMLQPTEDPLIYSVMPAYDFGRTITPIQYAFELAALTRRKGNVRLETTPYTYEFMTFIDGTGQLYDSWPFLSDHPALEQVPMQVNNPGQYRWLTEMDRQRYPKLVQAADEIAALNSGDKLQMIRNMEKYFSLPNGFKYTLDFRDIAFNDSLDPIEDFFSNHRSGHCELYASALTLMLRSQDIPARLVVGFFADEYDETSHCFMVRELHAHAWVECYLPPEDCTERMFRNRSAGLGGAWLRLDPTPPSELDTPTGAGSAIESARTLWQDYVLGLDASNQDQSVFEAQSNRLLALFDLTSISDRFQETTKVLEERPALQAGVIGAMLLLIMLGFAKGINWTRTRKKKKSDEDESQVGGLRRILGTALSLISPELGKWMLQVDEYRVSTGFYRRLIQILESSGWVREPAQSHREFANETSQRLSQQLNGNDPSGELANTITELTELFYEVRFGNRKLDATAQEKIASRLKAFEVALKPESA